MAQRLSDERQAILQRGLKALPSASATLLKMEGRNGESLATDEAAVWKRVLNYRLAAWLQPTTVLETHAGLGISTHLYTYACPSVQVTACAHWKTQVPSGSCFDLMDVDPFGAPWGILETVVPLLDHQGVLLVSNGEALAVWRNLRKQQRYPTRYYGKQMPRWVSEEYLPTLEAQTGIPVRFFYAFPSTIRVILSRRAIPTSLSEGCPVWMWWLAKYAMKSEGTPCGSTISLERGYNALGLPAPENHGASGK